MELLERPGRLAEVIARYIESKAPGFLKSFDTTCVKLYRMGCVELFLHEPEKFRNVLLRYNDIDTAKFITRYLFLQAILDVTCDESLMNMLSELLIEDPEVFKREMYKILSRIMKST